MSRFLSLPDTGSAAFKARWALVGVFATFLALGAMALDQPLAGLTQWEAACDSMDGGAPQDILIDTGGTTHKADSVYIANDSATCVRIGGTTLTSTTGATIGDGCRDGSGLSIDTKGGRCLSAGAAITVDVLAGRR